METLRYGISNNDVRLLQLALIRAGMGPDTIDGIFDEDTRRALRAFQRQQGLPPLGLVGPRTREALRPYLTGYLIHTAVKGDTLYQLGQHYGTPLDFITTANPQIVPTNMQIGQRVIIPLNFPVVPTDIPYSSYLLEYILEGLRARFPFLRFDSAGNSVLGRPLYQITMGDGPKEVFYNAAHHANEWITTPLLLAWLETYARAYSRGEAIYQVDAAKLYHGVTLLMIPMVNPDGVDLVNGALSPSSGAFARAQAISQNYPAVPFPSGWKANLRGTDLNLNYPAGWEEAKKIKEAQGFTGPAPRDYVGPAVLSEPESRALYNLTRSHDFALTLSYHTQGKLIYWKYLDYNPENSWPIAQAMAASSGYLAEETPFASGHAGYKDWFIQDYNRPGYTIEVGQGQNPLPLTQFGEIYRDNLGILTIGMESVIDS